MLYKCDQERSRKDLKV